MEPAMSTGEEVGVVTAPIVAEPELEAAVQPAAEPVSLSSPNGIPAEELDEKVSTPVDAGGPSAKTTQAIVALMKAMRRLPGGTRVTIDFSDGTQMQLPPVEPGEEEDELDTGGVSGDGGPSEKKRRVRHCLLCMEHAGGAHATTCKGRGGKRKCEYFNEDGSAKQPGSMPEAQAVLVQSMSNGEGGTAEGGTPAGDAATPVVMVAEYGQAGDGGGVPYLPSVAAAVTPGGDGALVVAGASGGASSDRKRTRHCRLCQQYGLVEESVSCKGRGGKQRCEYFNEDGSRKVPGQVASTRRPDSPTLPPTLSVSVSVSVSVSASASASASVATLTLCSVPVPSAEADPHPHPHPHPHPGASAKCGG